VAPSPLMKARRHAPTGQGCAIRTSAPVMLPPPIRLPLLVRSCRVRRSLASHSCRGRAPGPPGLLHSTCCTVAGSGGCSQASCAHHQRVHEPGCRHPSLGYELLGAVEGEVHAGTACAAGPRAPRLSVPTAAAGAAPAVGRLQRPCSCKAAAAHAARPDAQHSLRGPVTSRRSARASARPYLPHSDGVCPGAAPDGHARDQDSAVLGEAAVRKGRLASPPGVPIGPPYMQLQQGALRGRGVRHCGAEKEKTQGNWVRWQGGLGLR
jgi:hypothetical protein